MSEFIAPMQSITLEKHVIGAMFLDPACVAEVREILTPQDFYLDNHVLICEAMYEVDAEGKTADLIAVAQHLAKTVNRLTDAGGDAYLMEISAEVVSTANLKQHAMQLLDYSIRRRGEALGAGIMAVVRNREIEVPEIVGQIETAVSAFGAKQAQEGSVAVGKSMSEVLRRIEMTANGKLLGASTGYRSVDLRTGGLQGGKTYVIGGVPGSGKTLLAINIARNFAMRGDGVSVTSIEMDRTDLTMRLLVAEAGVDSGLIQTGRLPQREYAKLSLAAGAVHGMPIYVDQASRQTPGRIRSTLRRLIKERNIKLAVVDYFQLMTSDRKFKTRYEEMTQACIDLTHVVKDMGIPLILCVQLDKDSAKGGQPTMGNLKETGQIAQDATGICILHRPASFKKKLEFNKSDDVFDTLGVSGEIKPSEPENLTYAIWEKIRGGTGTGVDKLSFNGPHQKFEEWA